MPNRILKESICTSDNLDQLNSFQENVFYRLIVNCDDYGRIDARTKILAAKLYPLKDIRAEQIRDALQALSSAGLVILYEVDGKPFAQMKTWERHQQVRAKRSKYPGPESEKTQSDSKCNQMQSSDNKCPRNPIQSNPVVVDARARDDGGDDADALLVISETMNAAFEAAEGIGLKGGKSVQQANRLAADYSANWLLEAINRAALAPKDAWSWRYIEGILRSWKKNGGMDSPDKTDKAEKPKTRMVTENIVVDGKIQKWTHEVPV